MKLTITATVLEFDKEAYGRAIRDAIRKVFMKAGQKFLLAAIPKIHIWTGMARGAFRNLEDLVGKVTNDAQSGGVRIRTTKSTGTSNTAGRGGGDAIRQSFRRGYFYKPPGGSSIERTPQAGRQFATPTDQIFQLSGESTKTGNTSFHFRFAVEITYADIVNWWDAFAQGSEAFEEYVRANLEIPDPLKFTTRKNLKV